MTKQTAVHVIHTVGFGDPDNDTLHEGDLLGGLYRSHAGIICTLPSLERSAWFSLGGYTYLLPPFARGFFKRPQTVHVPRGRDNVNIHNQDYPCMQVTGYIE